MDKNEFMIGNHTFVINYLKDESLIDRFDYTNDYKAIEVHYKPTQLMKESEVKKIVNDNAELILMKFKKVIDEHQEVYKHFDYKLNLLDYTLSIPGGFNPQKVNPSMVLRIPLRLKNFKNCF